MPRRRDPVHEPDTYEPHDTIAEASAEALDQLYAFRLAPALEFGHDYAIDGLTFEASRFEP